MATLTKIGSFLTPTDTGLQQINGVGFRGRGALMLMLDRGTDGVAAGISRCLSFVSGALAESTFGGTYERGYVSDSSLDGSTNAHEVRTRLDSRTVSGCLELLDASALSVVLQAEFNGFTEDGFQLIWNTVSATQRVVIYLVFGGDVEYAAAGNFQQSSPGTNQLSENSSPSAVNFDPNVLLMLGFGRFTSPGPSTGVRSDGHTVSFGAIVDDGSAVKEWAVAGAAKAGAGAQATSGTLGQTWMQTSRSIVTISPYSMNQAAFLARFNAWRKIGDGLGGGLDYTVASAYENTKFFFLALKTPNAKAGAFVQPTVTGNQRISGLGFTPAAVLLASNCQPLSGGIRTDGMRMALGVGTNSGNQACTWVGYAGSASPTNASQALSRAHVLRFLTENHGAPTTLANAAIASVDSDGFTLVWSPADVVSRHIAYVAFGPMSPVWSYVPQEVMAEALTADTSESRVSLRSTVVGRETALIGRTFTLRYTLVTTAQCNSMAAFFDARRGAFEEFLFLNPNDGELYRTRFDSAMSIDYFTPGFLSLGEITLVQVMA